MQKPPSTPTNQTEAAAQPQAATPEPSGASEDSAALAARRQREKKAREAKAAESAANVAPSVAEPRSNSKRVVVTVTYDESGRVTQASGGDANALRIARQKRFPPGKAGSATVSIPIN